MKSGNLVPLSSAYLKEKFGVKPIYLPTFRTLVGDVSDGVPGIPRIPKELARTIAEACPDFRDFPSKYAELNRNLSSHSQKLYLVKVRSQFSRLLQNYNIIHSMDWVNEESVPVTIGRDYGDMSSKRTISHKYGFGHSTRDRLGLN